MGMWLPLVLIGVIVGFFAFWVYQFLAGTGTNIARIKAVFYNSATIVVSRISAIVSLVIGVGVNWADDPSMQEWLKGILDPKYSWAVVLSLMILVELARYRSMKPDDDNA